MLVDFFRNHPRVLILTGAGCSTGSGIPAYRDGSGQWNRRQPIFFQDFMTSAQVRRRYWARSYFGWPVMRDASPGTAHRALRDLHVTGRLAGLVTQNVDGLHQAAGHENVAELHGGLSRVSCMHCGTRTDRDGLQHELEVLNPDWAPEVLGLNPDGDAELDELAYPGFRVADCAGCGGMLKPDVVFFGESVPPARFQAIDKQLSEADALLIIGSSLVVWSGFRLVRDACAAGIPVAAVNEGRTRADAMLDFKLGGDCGEALADAAARLSSI